MEAIVTEKLINTMVSIMAVRNGIPTGKFTVHGDFDPTENIFGLDTKLSTSTVRVFNLHILIKDIEPYTGQVKAALENSTGNVKRILSNVFLGRSLNECIDILINAELSDPVKDRLMAYVMHHKTEIMLDNIYDKLNRLPTQ